jgi:hypothetical protein
VRKFHGVVPMRTSAVRQKRSFDFRSSVRGWTAIKHEHGSADEEVREALCAGTQAFGLPAP